MLTSNFDPTPEEFAKIIATEISEEIDQEVIRELIKTTNNCIEIKLQWVPKHTHIEQMQLWCKNQGLSNLFHFYQYWLFENEKDAILFLLRWGNEPE